MVKKATKKQKRPLYKTLLIWAARIIGGIVIIIGIIYVAFQVSPWPSALLLREAFSKNATSLSNALEKYVPTGVTSVIDQQYAPGNSDTSFDAYYPTTAVASQKALPTIVWIHGGGWISGDKKDVANYLKILASKGYTTIGINYSIAPEKTYPTPITQTNEALAYINKHASELHVDPAQIVLAGDSAGSQIAAQTAAIITNPSYATKMNMTPALQSPQLVGMLLSCGAYDVSIISTDGDSEGAKLLKTFLWSYSGTKNFLDDPAFDEASVIDYVTKAFPPSFITAGNDDPLLPQSQVMVKKLQSLGVANSPLFYPADYSPSLPHEYQFNLDTDAGKKALAGMQTFLAQHTHTQ